MAVSMIPNVTFELVMHAAFVADEIRVLCLNQLVVWNPEMEMPSTSHNMYLSLIHI